MAKQEKPQLIIGGKVRQAKYATESAVKIAESTRTLTEYKLSFSRGGQIKVHEFISPDTGLPLSVPELINAETDELKFYAPKGFENLAPKAICELMGIDPDNWDNIGLVIGGRYTSVNDAWEVDDYNELYRIRENRTKEA